MAESRHRRPQHRWATCAALVLLLTSSRASAFCWATTCRDEDPAICPRDANGCLETGQSLFWPDGALTVWSGAEGSMEDGISGDDLEKVVRRAFKAWANVTCADGLHPGITVTFAGQLVNGHNDVDKAPHAKNQNVVSFVDNFTPYPTGWPHDMTIVGLTTVSFDAKTGRLLDTDTELNSAQYCFINTETGIDTGQCGVDLSGMAVPAVDLLAVVTHEAGHQFGLDHTKVRGATMMTTPIDNQYQELRTLERDDKLGICTMYPSSFVEDVAGGGLVCRTVIGKTNDNWALPAFALLIMAFMRRASPRPKR